MALFVRYAQFNLVSLTDQHNMLILLIIKLLKWLIFRSDWDWTDRFINFICMPWVTKDGLYTKSDNFNLHNIYCLVSLRNQYFYNIWNVRMFKSKFRYVETIWTTAYANKSVVKTFKFIHLEIYNISQLLITR